MFSYKNKTSEAEASPGSSPNAIAELVFLYKNTVVNSFHVKLKHFSIQSRTFLLTIIFSLQQKTQFKFFSSEGYGGGTVLFSESSTMFQEVVFNEPMKWMGQNYYNTMKAMDCKKEGKSIFFFFCMPATFFFSPPTDLPANTQMSFGGACCPAVSNRNVVTWALNSIRKA